MRFIIIFKVTCIEKCNPYENVLWTYYHTQQKIISSSFLYRHSIFSSGSQSLFSRNTFPALSKTLYNILIDKSSSWDDLSREMSILVNHLNNAMMVLQGDTMELP